MRGRLVRHTWTADPAIYAPPRYRRACEYDAYVPDLLATLGGDLPGHVAGVVSDAEHAIAELNAQAGPELMPLARLLLRTESIASSKVEGMQMDARSLARAEANQETGRSVSSGAAEILANVDAMQLAIERAASPEPLEVDDIRDIHRALMERAPGNRLAGQVRDGQNWIGGNDYNPCGADYVPPPPEEVGRLLGDLCDFVSGETLPPIVQAALAHAQFETIHPFADGNGRTGRALIQVVLRRRRLAPAFVPPISVVLAREKPRYISGLTAFRGDAVATWIEQFAAAAAQAALLAGRYAERVVALRASWRARLRSGARPPREDAAVWALIDALPAHPIVTIPVGVAVTGRTRPAVANAIAELEGAGVLRPVSGSRRNRAWETEELLDLIVDLEAGEG